MGRAYAETLQVFIYGTRVWIIELKTAVQDKFIPSLFLWGVK